jgi:flagellar basal body rod protein FlgC
MSLFSSLSVSDSGMAAQRARAEFLVDNLANSESFDTDTAQSPFASIYRTNPESGLQEDMVDLLGRIPRIPGQYRGHERRQDMIQRSIDILR